MNLAQVPVDLSNLDPLPAESLIFVRVTVRFVAFFRKGTRIRVIL
jgi:hypothetical protein